MLTFSESGRSTIWLRQARADFLLREHNGFWMLERAHEYVGCDGQKRRICVVKCRTDDRLIVVTFDEANPVGASGDSRACEKANQADCLSPIGPNLTGPGTMLLNKTQIVPGSVNSTGSYNHYWALRSYEGLLGLREGGDERQSHLGYAGTSGLLPFEADVFTLLWQSIRALVCPALALPSAGSDNYSRQLVGASDSVAADWSL